LLERLEQGGYLRRRDADAAVDHLQQQRPRTRRRHQLQAQLDAAGIAELHCVRQ